MTHGNSFWAGAVVIALTLGITGQTKAPTETEKPLSTNDILVVTNDTGWQTDEPVKIDQPPRWNSTAGGASDENNGQ
jgi:hypothetical protein